MQPSEIVLASYLLVFKVTNRRNVFYLLRLSTCAVYLSNFHNASGFCGAYTRQGWTMSTASRRS